MDALLIPTFFCPKAWAGMAGDEKTRFCNYCQKQVHNLDVLSVEERLTLLKSPAASLCARYKIALRRPKKARKESYERHLLKYGAGVAMAGSALVLLWELSAAHGRNPALYRAVIPRSETGCTFGSEMPEEDYEEFKGVVLGGIGSLDFLPPVPVKPDPTLTASPHVDIQIDAEKITQLFSQLKAPTLEPIPYKK